MQYKSYTGFQQLNNWLKDDINFQLSHERKTIYISWEVFNVIRIMAISFGKL